MYEFSITEIVMHWQMIISFSHGIFLFPLWTITPLQSAVCSGETMRVNANASMPSIIMRPIIGILSSIGWGERSRRRSFEVEHTSYRAGKEDWANGRRCKEWYDEEKLMNIHRVCAAHVYKLALYLKAWLLGGVALLPSPASTQHLHWTDRRQDSRW